MKRKTIIAIVLIALGLFALNYNRIAYDREQERVGFGPFTSTVEREKTVSTSTILGVIAILAGGYLLLMKSKKK